ncbi:hypothetical protein Tco_1203648 [Tanacetum coccineum]
MSGYVDNVVLVEVNTRIGSSSGVRDRTFNIFQIFITISWKTAIEIDLDYGVLKLGFFVVSVKGRHRKSQKQKPPNRWIRRIEVQNSFFKEPPPVNGGQRWSKAGVNGGQRWSMAADHRRTTVGPPVNGG